ATVASAAVMFGIRTVSAIVGGTCLQIAASLSRRPERGMEIQRVVPVFRIFDVGKARDFYLGFLGFALDWEHRFEPDMPLYMQVSLGGFQLHLSEHHGDGTPGAVVFVQLA